MSKRYFLIPAGLILTGIILIFIALRPSESPKPATATTTVVALSNSTLAATAPGTAPATVTISLTATIEAQIVATNQQFVVPTITPLRSFNNEVETPGSIQTLEPGEVISRTATATVPPTETRPPLPTNTPGPSATHTDTPLPTVASTGNGAQISPPGYLTRFGVSGSLGSITNAAGAGLPFGSYLTWLTSTDPPRPNGAQFWQMVRVNNSGLRLPSYEQIDEVIAAQPGAIWIIGNEPDVIVQDNVGPERYAEIYHDVHTYIKARDSSAIIAIAGVAQPTPLRRAYLDRVLTHYQATYGSPMPIDIWTIHGFILREEANNWGAGIPPGMGVTQGTLYELADHANLDIFRQNLNDFRSWMVNRGYQETPLAVTEYGVIMPEEYGFPPELVQNFLVESFNFFLSANNGTGWSADGGRLFQYWFWYSVHDDFFATPNLYDPANNGLTSLGNRFASYIRG